MLTVRARYESNQRNYFQNLYAKFGEIPENHKKAIELRQNFFKTYILERVFMIQFNLSHLLNIKPTLRKTGHTLPEE